MYMNDGNGDYKKAIERKCVKGSKAGTILRVLAMKLYARTKVFDDVDQFICTCEFSKNKLIEGGVPAEKISCVPTFIDSSKITPCFENDKYFLFLGRMAHQKGTINEVEIRKDLSQRERMVDFISQIKNPYCYLDKGMVVKISFAGENRLEDTLKKCARTHRR